MKCQQVGCPKCSCDSEMRAAAVETDFGSVTVNLCLVHSLKMEECKEVLPVADDATANES